MPVLGAAVLGRSLAFLRSCVGHAELPEERPGGALPALVPGDGLPAVRGPESRRSCASEVQGDGRG